jgi:hypothetical protein
MNQDIKDLFSMLGFDKLEKDKQEKVKSLLNKIISKWRAGENSEAYCVMNGMLAQLKLDTLDEQARAEIKDKFAELLSRESGYSKSDFLFEFGRAFFNPYDIIPETTAASDIVGKDSNRFTDAYKRVLKKDGLFRQEPKQRKLDRDENNILKKLNALRKLFQSRNVKDIKDSDIAKILTSESQEQQIAAMQHLQEVRAALNNLNDSGANEKQILDYYFSESSPITSTFSHNQWSGYRYVKLSKSGVVIHSNTFLAQVGTKLSKDKIGELKAMGIQITVSESLNETIQRNDSILDDMTYDELLTTVYSNLERPDERSIMKEFENLLKMKIKDARFVMKKAVKQILKDVKE